MKNIYHQNNYNCGALQVQVEIPFIPFIGSNNNEKFDKEWVKIKFFRDSTSAKSDLYDFIMALFGNSNLEEFLLFIMDFQMTYEAAGILTAGANIKYLCILVFGKELHQLDMLSDEVWITNSEHLKSNILGLGAYLFPVNVLSKQNHAMRCGMRNPRSLKLKGYTTRMVGLNKCLDVFPGAKESNKICEP